MIRIGVVMLALGLGAPALWAAKVKCLNYPKEYQVLKGAILVKSEFEVVVMTEHSIVALARDAVEIVEEDPEDDHKFIEANRRTNDQYLKLLAWECGRALPALRSDDATQWESIYGGKAFWDREENKALLAGDRDLFAGKFLFEQSSYEASYRYLEKSLRDLPNLNSNEKRNLLGFCHLALAHQTDDQAKQKSHEFQALINFIYPNSIYKYEFNAMTPRGTDPQISTQLQEEGQHITAWWSDELQRRRRAYRIFSKLYDTSWNQEAVNADKSEELLKKQGAMQKRMRVLTEQATTKLPNLLKGEEGYLRGAQSLWEQFYEFSRLEIPHDLRRTLDEDKDAPLEQLVQDWRTRLGGWPAELIKSLIENYRKKNQTFAFVEWPETLELKERPPSVIDTAWRAQMREKSGGWWPDPLVEKSMVSLMRMHKLAKLFDPRGRRLRLPGALESNDTSQISADKFQQDPQSGRRTIKIPCNGIDLERGVGFMSMTFVFRPFFRGIKGDEEGEWRIEEVKFE